ncbi:MAG: DNA polymerase I [Gudongella sp.]|jgi:DNA polymerase-1|nr:DNA polymerase I [Gudongella sp.]
MTEKKLMVIDGSSLVHRAFYAMPLLNTKSGIYTNAVLGFINMFNRIIEEYKPTHICVAFDRGGKTLRHHEYEDYKGTRDKTPGELSQQFPIVKEILQYMGIKTLDMQDYEADDIAGTLASKGESDGMEVFLVTGDRDYLQLASDSTKVLLTKKGISEVEVYDKDRIEEEYGVAPKAFIDIKGLMGDKSDNIPGVPGVGEKTALKLISEYGTLEEVYNSVDNISGAKLKERLIENKSQAFLSRKLGEIILNVPLDLGLEDLETGDASIDKLREKYEELEFRALLSKLPARPDEITVKSYPLPTEIKNPAEAASMIKEIENKEKVVFKILFEGDYLEDNAIYFILKCGAERLNYFKMNEPHSTELLMSFRQIFESPEIIKIGWDMKAELGYMLQLGWDLNGFNFDASIAEYIINPSQSNLSINKLSEEYFGIFGPDIISQAKKEKKLLSEMPEKELLEYLSFIVQTTEKLEPPMMEIITERNMHELFDEVEMPLVEVLASMERSGVAVDTAKLEELGQEYTAEIEELEKLIYKYAGRDFNINSTKQLGEILFEDLNLRVIKKTKTGYSTDAEVLETLQDDHPIVLKLLRYRQITKLRSTYIDGMIPLIKKDTGRIHSKFNQTVTSTGRISSTEPNLQNIPVRTEDGRKIRKAFVAEKPGFKLLDGDYSQIELRILAHISGDPKMKDAFIHGVDIHSKTASEVFGVPLEDVTSDLRYKAKTVNFSIIYGISDFSLSKDLGIARKEARTYIDNYFKNYEKVKEYMDSSIASGRNHGYVETLLNRRRYIPELESRNFNIRGFGERVAMNMPIQGSAADIIKLAMVKVYKRLKDEKLKSRLILTIHDELIIEAYVDEINYVTTMMKDIMENAIKLDVPLKVDIVEGDSWYDTK